MLIKSDASYLLPKGPLSRFLNHFKGELRSIPTFKEDVVCNGSDQFFLLILILCAEKPKGVPVSQTSNVPCVLEETVDQHASAQGQNRIAKG